MYENPYMGNQYMQQIPRYNGMQYQQMQQPVYQNPVQQSPTQQQAAVPQLIGRTTYRSLWVQYVKVCGYNMLWFVPTKDRRF